MNQLIDLTVWQYAATTIVIAVVCFIAGWITRSRSSEEESSHDK